jgi:hypothetical protein
LIKISNHPQMKQLLKSGKIWCLTDVHVRERILCNGNKTAKNLN